MRNRRVEYCLLCLSIIARILPGCGEQSFAEEEKNPYVAAVSMETTPVLDYVVPRLLPNIMVDREGYTVGDEKEAIVKGSVLPEQFVLVDESDGEIVYQGKIEQIQYHEEQGIYSGIVDFSDYDEVGNYYLECDRIGQSPRFLIQDELYDVLFRQTYEQIMESCQKGLLPLQDALILLQAYEWNGSVFPDENRDEVPDVLQELSQWIIRMEGGSQDQSDETVEREQDEVLYAAFLAKFSYLYQTYDYAFATDCLKRASTVYGQMNQKISKDADNFWALTELYRATGHYTYRQKITEYDSFFENNGSYLEEPEYMYGTMTYLATRQRVDTKLCEILMGNIMERAEQVSNRYQEMIYPMTARNNGTEDLLKRAVEVSCANYVMNNYQYTQIIEDFLHYLMGCNRDSVNFYHDTEKKTDYILLLSQLAANHRK